MVPFIFFVPTSYVSLQVQRQVNSGEANPQNRKYNDKPTSSVTTDKNPFAYS